MDTKTKAQINIILKKIEKHVSTVVNEIGIESADVYRGEINNTVYSIPEGQYERTRALLNSVKYSVTKNGSEFIVKIGTDPDLMNSEHPSWVDGSNQNENISAWINYGHHGIVDYTPANYVESSENIIKKVVLKKFNSKLTKLGYVVK